MIKKLNVSKKMKVFLMSVGIGLSLTACSGETEPEKESTVRQIELDKEYDLEKMFFLYKDGELHLSRISRNYTIHNFYDFITNDYLGELNIGADFNTEYSYGEDENNSAYQLIHISNIISGETVSGKTLEEIKNDMDSMEAYIDENYGYELVRKASCNGDDYYNYLKIYSFNDELTGDITYHIGYNASRVDNSCYIYDICKKDIYRIPDIGSVDNVKLSEIYDGDSITINEAQKLLEQYISESVKVNTKSMN